MFKWVSYTEGASLLLLLFIAMPLKYMFDIHEAVSIVGMAHGVLFIIYMLFVASFFFSKQWTFKTSLLASIASIIPFGPFVLENRIIKQQQPPAI
ncbi:hypothetical protein JCM19046_1367 [Bacillus sp. JCM 19046]|uniref:Integral membrane protein n=1 Tax=Shouchella xiaoxiensis TaxID=766895 RepID=A0ABS2SYI3_9BACI|nr:DUF3817 domain-containing protein [Shouchella xiaoxiensis]MBM7840554.1 integral membrane protein [Shouchella xiaoxiensis]GAF12702.1 hypothetical protein JCM19045_1911 [Bacillus sp. JCM 19045]GAF16902.1 hypothetical protein JCM19046_1367 [Bacillus sp. JCM 19046]